MLLQNLSCAYYQNGNYSKAKEKIKKLIKMGFESFQGSVLLGHISEQENNIEEAINSYKKAIELDKYNLSAYLYLAGCLRNNWRLDEAMNVLNIATKINTLDSKSEVYYQYAESLREKGLYSEAKKMYKECIIITRPGKLQEIAKKQLESIFNYENKTSEYKKVTLFQSRYVV